MTNLIPKLIWQTSNIPEQELLAGHQGQGIMKLALTRDGRYALTLNFQYRELIVWDFASGQQLLRRNWAGYDKVRGFYLTPDDQYAVVTGETGGMVLLPGVAQGAPTPAHLPSGDYVCMAANGQRAISAEWQQAGVWDLGQSYTRPLPLPKDAGKEAGLGDWLAISADERYGFAWYGDLAIAWDLENGQLVWQHAFPRVRLRALTYISDKQLLLLGYGKSIEAWDWQNDRRAEPALEVKRGRITALALTPDERTLLAGVEDGTIWVWDWEEGRLLNKLAGHSHDISGLVVSPDGEFCASSGEDTTLRKWHIASGKQVYQTFRSYRRPDPLSIDPHGRFVITSYGLDRSTLAVYRLEDGALNATLCGHQGDINALNYFDNERFLLSASDDHTLRIWNLKTGRCVQILQGAHDGAVKAASIVPGKWQVTSAAEDGSIVLWDLPTSRPARLPFCYMPPGSWTDFHVSLEPSGRMALVNQAIPGQHDMVMTGKIALWDIKNGQEQRLKIGGSPVFSPNGKWIFWQTQNYNGLDILDWQTAHMVNYQAGGRMGNALAFTPDGNRVFVALSGQAALVDLASGEEIGRFKGGSDRTSAVALSQDGLRGAVSTTDKFVRVWEMHSGRLLAEIPTEEHIFALALDPSGRYLACGGSQVTVYDLG